jgi:hypothetical protein
MRLGAVVSPWLGGLGFVCASLSRSSGLGGRHYYGRRRLTAVVEH